MVKSPPASTVSTGRAKRRKQITAATVYRDRGPLLLLSYFRIRAYPLDALDTAPVRVVPLAVVKTLGVFCCFFVFIG